MLTPYHVSHDTFHKSHIMCHMSNVGRGSPINSATARNVPKSGSPYCQGQRSRPQVFTKSWERVIQRKPSVYFRNANTEPSMHFRKANTEPSMNFRGDNTKFLSCKMLGKNFHYSVANWAICKQFQARTSVRMHSVKAYVIYVMLHHTVTLQNLNINSGIPI